ncbi:hypothetical protein QAD02_014723 [Eretmocerus hayati]|uniref:Uncharacterized protein n=1 Tax=Eretmocerus hayati TaxID=131215 RepID=A0ACC2P678_9HYME|nr:hypothetical protein QAD02_014723 [Eretmocerus hayati]
MFWGLIMEPNKRYTQTVESAFHLSMASLDAQASGADLVQVMISYDGRTYLLLNGKEHKTEKDQTQKKKKDDNKSIEKTEQQQPKKRLAEGGVQVEDIREGNGPVAKSGKFVTVYYIGKLKSGKKFDQTTHGEGFKFRLGKGEVIKGWDVGIAGMKVGGKRRIVIPPQMGYGSKGSPPVIPPNSQLHFEVELRGVH